MNYYTNLDQVAVIIHDDWGSGWYTYHEKLELLFDPELAQALDTQNTAAARDRLDQLAEEYPEFVDMLKQMNPSELAVEWIPRGKKFIIYEYDGIENIWLKDKIRWIQT